MATASDTQEAILILIAITLGILVFSMLLFIIYICIFQQQIKKIKNKLYSPNVIATRK
ncbi:Hypothetical predicted protein [Paramuricea clavata]|uniref:Uncharacterized protein n=1 Tax=Paramuricea clavata TaxID=317549 RepID=A0A7D9IWA6_PARCT|nr:Hypothetical predicted protein [Paramuricea clavata]